LTEFAYNNTMHSSTKQIPLFSNYGHHPRADPFQVKDVGSHAVEDLAAHLAVIYDELAFQFYELKTAIRTMQIVIGRYILIFTLEIKCGFYDGIYKQKDHQST
jgi:hypothetical protein